MKRDSNHIVIKVEALSGEQYFLRGLFFIFALSLLTYFYFVGLSIMNVISHREASVESERLRSVVSSLEKEYFDLAQSVTPALGASLGLAPTAQTDFVRRATGMASNVQNTGL